MKQVTVLALPGALGTSITIPLEMLNAADLIMKVRDRSSPRLPLHIAAPKRRLLTLTGGLEIMPAVALQAVQYSDLIFVPALWGNPAAVVRQHPEVVAWLRHQHDQGATICCVGTGSFFAAEAGLLDGKAATTHWYYFDSFTKRYPEARLQRKRFITHENRLYCTGSVNAVRDVMLYFVEKLFDASVADEVSRHFTHELKRSYESMLLHLEQQDSHHDETVIKIQEWLQKHYHSEVKLKDLAARFDLSVRSLNRRFRLAANLPPLQYLQQIRIDEAKALLKKSNLSVAEIAFKVGYQDTSYFAALFKKNNSVGPREYRQLVRSKLFNVEIQG